MGTHRAGEGDNMFEIRSPWLFSFPVDPFDKRFLGCPPAPDVLNDTEALRMDGGRCFHHGRRNRSVSC